MILVYFIDSRFVCCEWLRFVCIYFLWYLLFSNLFDLLLVIVVLLVVCLF